MITFITDRDMGKIAKNLDSKRLFKTGLLEAYQILDILVNQKTGAWSNHPTVKMWRGYEIALFHYIKICWVELQSRRIATKSKIFSKCEKLMFQYCQNHGGVTFKNGEYYPKINNGETILPEWWGKNDIISAMRGRLRCKGFADLSCAAIKKHLKLQNINNWIFQQFGVFKNSLNYQHVLKLKKIIKKWKIPVEKSFYEQFGWDDDPNSEYVFPVGNNSR